MTSVALLVKRSWICRLDGVRESAVDRPVLGLTGERKTYYFEEFRSVLATSSTRALANWMATHVFLGSRLPTRRPVSSDSSRASKGALRPRSKQ